MTWRELQVIHTRVGVEWHAYRWFLEAAASAAHLVVMMIPQGNSVQELPT